MSARKVVDLTSPRSRDTYGTVSPPPTMYDTSSSTTESWSTARSAPLHQQQPSPQHSSTSPYHHQHQQLHHNEHNPNHVHPLKPHNYNSTTTTAMTNNSPHHAASPAASSARRSSFKSQAALLVSTGSNGLSPRHPMATPRSAAEYNHKNNSFSSPQHGRRNSENYNNQQRNGASASNAAMASPLHAAPPRGGRAVTTQSEPGVSHTSPYAPSAALQRHANRYANDADPPKAASVANNNEHLHAQQKQQPPVSPSTRNAASAARTAFLARRQQQRKQERQQKQIQSDPRPSNNNHNSVHHSFDSRSLQTNENEEPVLEQRATSKTSYPDPEPVVLASDEEEQQFPNPHNHQPQSLPAFYAPSASSTASAESKEHHQHRQDNNNNNATAAKRFSSPASVRRKPDRPPQQQQQTQLSSSESRYAKAANAALSRTSNNTNNQQGAGDPGRYTNATPRSSTGTTSGVGNARNQWQQRDGIKRSYSDRFEELRKQAASVGERSGKYESRPAGSKHEESRGVASARKSRGEREDERRDRMSTSLPPVRRRRPLQQPQEGAPHSANRSSEILQDLDRTDVVHGISTGSPQRISEIKERLWGRDERLQSSIHPPRSLSPQQGRRHSTSGSTPVAAAAAAAASGFKSKFYQAAVAAQRETVAPFTPPRTYHPREEEPVYNDGGYQHPRNSTPPRPRPMSPAVSSSRRSATPPRSSNSSAFHEHRSATPPRPITANTAMPPTPPQLRSRSMSPGRARRAPSVMEQEQLQVPLPSGSSSSNNNGETSKQLIGKRSVASLVAKLSAVSRDDPHAALAQIDHILRAESSDDIQLLHDLYGEPSAAALPQHSTGVAHGDHQYPHQPHMHTHDQHEEGASDDDDEGSSDEETSVSEITDPTYMSSKPTHEQLHDQPPPLGLSTTTYRRPRPSTLQGYNTPAATNQAVAGLELVQRHHQRRSTKKNRAIAAQVHAQANGQTQVSAQPQITANQQQRQTHASDFANASENKIREQLKPPPQKNDSPGHAGQALSKKPSESEDSDRKQQLAELQRQQQELVEQQELLKMEKLLLDQKQKADKASFDDHERQQLQNDQEVDEWHRHRTGEMQEQQQTHEQNSRTSVNDDRSSAKEINRSSSFVSGAAATHTSTTSTNQDKSRKQQASADTSKHGFEVINTNTPEKIIQPARRSISNNPFDDSIDFADGPHEDVNKSPGERKLDRFISRKQKKHEDQLHNILDVDEQDKALMAGEDIARKLKAWDELSNPVSMASRATKASEVDDDKGTASGASLGANSGPGLASASPAVNTSTAAISLNTSTTQSVQSRSSRRSHPWETSAGKETPSSRFEVDTRDTSMDNALGVEAEFFTNHASPARELRKERLARAAMERVREDQPQNFWDESSNALASTADSKAAASRESGERTVQDSVPYAALDTSRDSSTQVVPRIMPVAPLAQQQEANQPQDAFQVDPKLLGRGFEVTPIYGASARMSQPASVQNRWVDMPSNTFFARKHKGERDVSRGSSEQQVVATLVDEDGTQPVTMVRSQQGGLPPASPLVRVKSVPADVSDAFAELPFEDTDLTDNSKRPLLVSPNVKQSSQVGFPSSQIDGSVVQPSEAGRSRRGISSFLKKRARGRKKGGASPSPAPRKDHVSLLHEYSGRGTESAPNSATKPRGRRLSSKSPARDRARSIDRRASDNQRSRSQSVEDGGRIRNPNIAKKFSRLLKVYGNELNDGDRGYC